MKFMHLYAAWMVGLVAARLLGLLNKTVFEALVIFGITVAAASAYKRNCEFHHDLHMELAKSS